MKHLFLIIALAFASIAINAQNVKYESQRPAPQERLFVSQAVEAKINEVTALLTNDKVDVRQLLS